MISAGEWTTFSAPLEVLPWGRNVYTVLMLPSELTRAAADYGTRRLEGTINDMPVNVGINRADVTEHAFVYAGKALQRQLGVRAGAVVDCRLRPADPDEVPIAGDIAEALADAGLLEAFEQLRPARRRQLLAVVEGAGTSTTRNTRVDDVIRTVRREAEAS